MNRREMLQESVRRLRRTLPNLVGAAGMLGNLLDNGEDKAQLRAHAARLFPTGIHRTATGEAHNPHEEGENA